MGTTAEKLTYLGTTKQNLKTVINAIGGDLDDEDTFRSYANVLNTQILGVINGTVDLFEEYPKSEPVEGTSLFINKTVYAPMKVISLSGKTVQDENYKIYTVKANNKIKETGKNLWGGFNYSTTSEDVDYSYTSDGTITANGTASTNLSYSTNGALTYNNKLYVTLPAGTYNVSLTDLPENTSWQIVESQIDSTTLNILYSPSQTNKTFTLSKETRITIRIHPANGTQLTNTIVKVMMVTGEKIQTWKQHNEDNYLIDLGTNIFDKNTSTTLDGKYINSQGSLTTSTKSGYLTSYVSVKPNTTYTINGSIAEGSNSFAIYYYDNTQSWIERTSAIQGKNLPYTFTTPNNCYYIQFQYTILDYNQSTVIIREGKSVGDYIPYGKLDIELCEIPNTDYINIIYQNKVDNPLYNDALNENSFYLIKKVGKIDSYNGETIETDYLSTTGSLDIGATIYYGLITPEYIEITDNTLITQLTNFFNSYSKEEQTNITQLNEEQPFKIKLSTLLDLEV